MSAQTVIAGIGIVFIGIYLGSTLNREKILQFLGEVPLLCRSVLLFKTRYIGTPMSYRLYMLARSKRKIVDVLEEKKNAVKRLNEFNKFLDGQLKRREEAMKKLGEDFTTTCEELLKRQQENKTLRERDMVWSEETVLLTECVARYLSRIAPLPSWQCCNKKYQYFERVCLVCNRRAPSIPSSPNPHGAPSLLGQLVFRAPRKVLETHGQTPALDSEESGPEAQHSAAYIEQERSMDHGNAEEIGEADGENNKAGQIQDNSRNDKTSAGSESSDRQFIGNALENPEEGTYTDREGRKFPFLAKDVPNDNGDMLRSPIR